MSWPWPGARARNTKQSVTVTKNPGRKRFAKQVNGQDIMINTRTSDNTSKWTEGRGTHDFLDLQSPNMQRVKFCNGADACAAMRKLTCS